MNLLLSTIALRPYVFVFLAAFLLAAIVNYGFRTTLIFGVIAWLVALGCEWSSINNGFPFGLYHYSHATYGREIWVAGVPFFDSLSFVFLSFASYSMALLLTTPLYCAGFDLRLLDTWNMRRSLHVWVLGSIFMVMVDMVVDPLSVHGDRWFLGNLFWYDPPGPYFGVPITNFLGWLLVAAICIAVFQLVDRMANTGGEKPRGMLPEFPLRALLGALLYVGMVGFGIAMLFVIRQTEIAWASVFIYLPFFTLGISILARGSSYGDRVAIARHIRDFPYDAAFPTADSPPASRSRRA
jgi:putative membrane protein